jgi:hypothetical protein
LESVIPGKSLVIVEWSGTEAVWPVAKDTAFGKTLSEPQVERFFRELGRSIDLIVRKEATHGGGTELYDLGKGLLTEFAHLPTALALIDVGFTEQGPKVELALICKAGARSGELVQRLESLLQAAQMPPAQEVTIAGQTLKQVPTSPHISAYYGVIEGYFVVAVSPEAVESVAAAVSDPKTSQAGQDLYAQSRKKIDASPKTRGAAIYVNVETALDRVSQIIPMATGGDESAMQAFNAVAEGIGISGVKSAHWELHFRDGGCWSRFFVHAPSPRRGLLAFLKDTPITDKDLAVIPKDPAWAVVYNMDIAGLYREILSVVEAAEPDAHAEMTAAIAKAEAAVGFRIDQDLLGLIGDTLVLFDPDELSSFALLGITKVFDCQEPDRMNDSMQKLVQFIDGQTNDARIRVKSIKHRDHEVYFLDVAGWPIPAAPSWSAHEGRVVVAMFPQTVTSALDRMIDDPDGKNSLLANEHFQAGRKHLPSTRSAFGYKRTAAVVEQAYTWLLLIGHVGVSMGQEEIPSLDRTAIPPLPALTKHLFSETWTATSDDQGVMISTFAPLPFTTPALMASSDMTTLPLMTSILLPSLSRARQSSVSLKSASNLSNMVVGCHHYAMQHEYKFPPNLEALVAEGFIDAKLLRHPNDDSPGHSYVYIGGQSQDDSSLNVIAHERFDLAMDGRINVAFLDARVEKMTIQQCENAVRETRSRLPAR